MKRGLRDGKKRPAFEADITDIVVELLRHVGSLLAAAAAERFHSPFNLRVFGFELASGSRLIPDSRDRARQMVLDTERPSDFASDR